MKNLKYIVAVLLFSTISTSCEKFLDTHPKDSSQTENYYNTETQLNAGLTGVYSILGSETLYGNTWFTIFEAPTDLSFYRRNNVFSGPQVLNFDASATEVRDMWQTLYTGISRANLVLDNIQKPKMDETKRGVIKGEALFLRAYYYFVLVSNWGDVPLVLDSKTDINNANIARTKTRVVYDQIIKDMEESEALVQDITTIGYGGRVSKSAVRGILARVNLYMAGAPLNDVSRYAEVVKWTEKVIGTGTTAIHSLNNNYSQVFINYAQDKYDIGESIWEVEFWGNRIGNNYQESGRVGNTNGIQCNDIAQGYSYGFIGATSKLYNLYESTDNRRDWAIGAYTYAGNPPAVVTKSVFTAAQIYQRMCGKFRRESETLQRQKNYTPQNFPLLRYADVLLMYAEAKGHDAAGISDALVKLNLVRARAAAKQYTLANANLPANPVDLLNLIKDERARELCFEGLRVNDLKRWGIYISSMQSLANDYATNASPANFKYTALAGQNIAQRHLLFPIPLREISINPLLTQNPNW